LSTIYSIGQIRSFMAPSESVKDLFKGKTFTEPTLAQLDKVLYQWFTTRGTVGKLMTGPKITPPNIIFVTGQLICV
jgi:hypothetical protein